jgi:hypothetical protein
MQTLITIHGGDCAAVPCMYVHNEKKVDGCNVSVEGGKWKRLLSG